MSNTRCYQLSESEALLAFRQVSSHIQALKNYIATHVESSNMEGAQVLVKELREYEQLYGKLNVEAHKLIDRIKKG
jgi:hypothetical protein